MIANYPPVYPLITASFVWILRPSLLIGRLITFVSALLIALIVRRSTLGGRF